jgi:hypothetical protein
MNQTLLLLMLVALLIATGCDPLDKAPEPVRVVPKELNYCDWNG